MALIHSTMTSLGSKSPDFSLMGSDGVLYSLGSFKNYKVLALIFMCNHCPYVKAVLDRLISLQRKYLTRGVRFVGINPNDTDHYPEDSMDNMKKLVLEKNIPFPYVIDERQVLAEACGAVCTPDIFVYGAERTLLYRGRIDDNWKESKKVTQEDLRDAIDMILEDGQVFADQIPSMGCSIKWKP